MRLAGRRRDFRTAIRKPSSNPTIESPHVVFHQPRPVLINNFACANLNRCRFTLKIMAHEIRIDQHQHTYEFGNPRAEIMRGHALFPLRPWGRKGSPRNPDDEAFLVDAGETS